MSQTDNEWIQRATAQLQASGRRAGGARAEVIAQLSTEGCAVSAEQIERQLVTAGRQVGRASIYRALEALAEVGAVQRVDLGEGGSRWERVGSDPHHHHHHLVCNACGSIVAFEDDGLESALHKLGAKNGFSVEAHEVTLHGLCPACTSTTKP